MPKATSAVAVLTLTGGLMVGLAPPSAAAPLAVPRAEIPPRTVQVDVDGDKRNDTVTVTATSPDRYKVEVLTKKGRRAEITITSTIATDWDVEPWWGAAKLDKVKGHELLLATGAGDGYSSVVLTWRKNSLVRQPAPKARSSKYAWYAQNDLNAKHGYRFFNSNGKRYVEQFGLFKYSSASNARWEGRITKSRWTGSSWKKISAKNVKLTDKKAKRYQGFSGVKIVAKPS